MKEGHFGKCFPWHPHNTSPEKEEIILEIKVEGETENRIVYSLSTEGPSYIDSVRDLIREMWNNGHKIEGLRARIIDESALTDLLSRIEEK